MDLRMLRHRQYCNLKNKQFLCVVNRNLCAGMDIVLLVVWKIVIYEYIFTFTVFLNQ